MKTEKKTGWEMNVIVVVFFLMCVATLLDIVPGIDGSTWATRLYGIISLVGVSFCARRVLFMTIDSFVLMYPKGLQKLLNAICQALMLLFSVFLEVVVIYGFVHYLGSAGSTLEELYTGLLFVVSILVYPVTVFHLFRNLKRKQGSEE